MFTCQMLALFNRVAFFTAKETNTIQDDFLQRFEIICWNTFQHKLSMIWCFDRNKDNQMISNDDIHAIMIDIVGNANYYYDNLLWFIILIVYHYLWSVDEFMNFSWIEKVGNGTELAIVDVLFADIAILCVL